MNMKVKKRPYLKAVGGVLLGALLALFLIVEAPSAAPAAQNAPGLTPKEALAELQRLQNANNRLKKRAAEMASRVAAEAAKISGNDAERLRTFEAALQEAARSGSLKKLETLAREQRDGSYAGEGKRPEGSPGAEGQPPAGKKPQDGGEKQPPDDKKPQDGDKRPPADGKKPDGEKSPADGKEPPSGERPPKSGDRRP